MATLGERVDALEKTNVAYDALLKALEKTDTQTSNSVEHLAKVINDPEVGLIVRLREFQAESRSDRRATKAWIAGAGAVVSVIYTIITVFAPFIRAMLHVTP